MNCRAVGVFLAFAQLAFASVAVADAETFQDCDACPEMVSIPSGTAMLGVEPFEANTKGNDGALREVTIGYEFALAKTETTRAQYRSFMQDSNHVMSDDGCNTWTYNRILGYVKNHKWDAPGYPQNEQHPVVCVSHADATAFAKWLSEKTGKAYRLLSSTEFEYATRAGTRGPWFWGTNSKQACEFANVADAIFRDKFRYAPVFDCNDGYEYTAPVATYAANPWGLHDMLGNAWEWTDDCMHRDMSKVPLDGRAWLAEDGGECERRTPRGGSWVSGSDWVRAGAQAGDFAVYHSQLLGFRVALTIAE